VAIRVQPPVDDWRFRVGAVLALKTHAVPAVHFGRYGRPPLVRPPLMLWSWRVGRARHLAAYRPVQGVDIGCGGNSSGEIASHVVRNSGDEVFGTPRPF
jgi:hypothetical protein